MTVKRGASNNDVPGLRLARRRRRALLSLAPIELRQPRPQWCTSLSLSISFILSVLIFEYCSAQLRRGCSVYSLYFRLKQMRVSAFSVLFSWSTSYGRSARTRHVMREDIEEGEEAEMGRRSRGGDGTATAAAARDAQYVQLLDLLCSVPTSSSSF